MTVDVVEKLSLRTVIGTYCQGKLSHSLVKIVGRNPEIFWFSQSMKTILNFADLIRLITDNLEVLYLLNISPSMTVPTVNEEH